MHTAINTIDTIVRDIKKINYENFEVSGESENCSTFQKKNYSTKTSGKRDVLSVCKNAEKLCYSSVNSNVNFWSNVHSSMKEKQ